MALSRAKVWIAGEVLTASDLNSEFNNILNNAVDLWSPATKAPDLDGFALILDADGNTKLDASTNDQINITVGGKTSFGLAIAASMTLAGATDTAGQDVYLQTADAGGTATAARLGGALEIRTGDGSSNSGAIAAGAGGATTLQSGSGGANTGGASGQAGGAGGALTAQAGPGGASNATLTNKGGNGGDLALAAGAGGSSAGTVTSSSGGTASLTAGAGGDKNGTGNAAGGAGGPVNLTSGAGGATASTGANAGGNAGAINLTALAGGNATAGTGNGGIGGSIVLTPGAGGTSSGGTAGATGTVQSVGRFTTTDGVSAGTVKIVGGTAKVGVSASDSVTAAASNNAFVDFTTTYAIPASTLKSGSVLRARALVRVSDASGADTLTVKLVLGSTDLISTTAVDPGATTDLHIMEFEITSRAAPSATSSLVGSGRWITNTGGTIAHGTGLLGATNFATNGALTLKGSAKWSSNTANTACLLESFNVWIN